MVAEVAETLDCFKRAAVCECVPALQSEQRSGAAGDRGQPLAELRDRASDHAHLEEVEFVPELRQILLGKYSIERVQLFPKASTNPKTNPKLRRGFVFLLCGFGVERSVL